MASASFDPAQYKRTTREQWHAAAEPWSRWGPVLERWLGDATESMLDLAAVEPGARVLDVAAGAGGQTLVAARRVGPSGAVLATDISPTILEFAAASAREAGLRNPPWSGLPMSPRLPVCPISWLCGSHASARGRPRRARA